MRRLPPLLAILVASTALGCKPQIGDSCKNSVDCSVRGDRICDVAAHNGYCTIRGCDPDTCPDQALCVEWRYDQDRSSESWCMQRCKNDGDCDRKRYRCAHVGDPILLSDPNDPESQPLARIADLDPRAQRRGFCVYVDSASSIGASLASEEDTGGAYDPE